MDAEQIRRQSRSIDQLLGRQQQRIRTRVFAHGAGWVVAASLAVVTVAFLLDYSLGLPAIVRVLLSAAGIAYLIAGLRRRLIGPMRVSIAEKDVALAVEARFPEIRQELISAVELGHTLTTSGEASLRSQSAAMIAQVVARASERAATLPLADILSPRRTIRVWAIAIGVAAIAATAVLPRLEAFGVFLRRAFGVGIDYPRRTHLHVELPDQESEFRIERTDGEAIVTLAAGADLPVLVRADGVVPRESFLIVEGGRGLPASIGMTQRPGERFRHVFRRVQGEFSFFARGGDDDRGDLVVHVRSIEPPLVSGVDATLEFPAYTGLEPQRRAGGAIEALIGTHVTLEVSTTSPVTHAELRLVQAASTIRLEPSRLEDDSGVGRRFTGSFDVVSSDQYEVYLVGPQGIANPRPASYPILAVEDHAPSGRILDPAGDDVQVVLRTARIPLRLEARDDFGIARIALATAIGGSEQVRRQDLLAVATPPQPQDALVVELLEVSTLGVDGTGAQDGDAIALEVALTDNRAPDAGTTELARRTVHVVDEIELMRRLSAHFRRVRDDVENALFIQRDRRDALEGFLEAVPDPALGNRNPQLVTLEVGQGRVLTAARRIRDGLQRAFDVHLFNRLEGLESPHAAAAVEFWLAFHRRTDSRSERDPAFYIALAQEQREGRIGRMEKALDPLLAMTLSAERIVTDQATNILRALELASIATDRNRLTTILTEVRGLQEQTVTELETLLASLNQWNEFQDVVQSARALRDAQRDLEYRTRARRGGEEKR